MNLKNPYYAILFVAIFSLPLFTSNASGLTWTTEAVDRGGTCTSIATDLSGNAHISYYRNGLSYATNASGTWVIQRVDNSASGGGNLGWGERTSIALDASGKVHICYAGDRNSRLIKYATNASGSWVIEVVAAAGALNYMSMALDSSGKAHISYEHPQNQALLYATNTTGTWKIETVETGGRLGKYTSIALDSSGKVHISYEDWENLKYATNASGSWATEEVADGGEYTSIALDSSDKVHISHAGSFSSGLQYSTNASGTWVTVKIGNFQGFPFSFGNDENWPQTSIALDSSGIVHIGHLSRIGQSLEYSTNATGTWQTETVDNSSYTGTYASLAIDTSGNIHISYYGRHYGISLPSSLMYAYAPAGKQVVEGQIWDVVEFTGSFNPIGIVKKVEFIKNVDGKEIRIDAEIVEATESTIRVRIPEDLISSREDFLKSRLTSAFEIVPVEITVFTGQGHTVWKDYACKWIYPWPLIVDEVVVPNVPWTYSGITVTSGQQILPQFQLTWPDRVATFFFDGSKEKSVVALRVLNTALGFPLSTPLTLEAIIINPGSGEIPTFTIPIVEYQSGDAGVSFDEKVNFSQTGFYVIVVRQKVGPLIDPPILPSPFQIHLSGDVGLPRKIVNGSAEFPRGTRYDTLFNHPASRPQSLVGLNPNAAQNALSPVYYPHSLPVLKKNAAKTALFKFHNLTSIYPYAAAVMIPTVETGFVPGATIIRAPDPPALIEITTPTARTSASTGAVAPAPGMVIDMTQIPDPASVVSNGPLASTVGAVIGRPDGAGYSFGGENSITSLIFDMGSGQEIVNGQGDDFSVFSTSGDYTVAVGNSPFFAFSGDFKQIGDTATGEMSFDLAGTGLSSARYVRIVAFPEVIIDAVQALNMFTDEVRSDIGPAHRVDHATITMQRQKNVLDFDPFLKLIAPDGSLLAKGGSGFGDPVKVGLDYLTDPAFKNIPLVRKGFYRFLGSGYDITPHKEIVVDGNTIVTLNTNGNFFVRLETGGNYDTNKIKISQKDEIKTVPQKRGRITKRRQRDSYLFQASPGQQLSISVNGDGDPSFNPMVELYDPEGFLIGANDDFYDGYRGRNAVLTITLPTVSFSPFSPLVPLPNPSTYRIVVSAIDKATGQGTIKQLEGSDSTRAYLSKAGSGSYELKVFTGAVHFDTVEPVSCDMDGNGKDEVIIDFGHLNGLWIRRDNGTLARLDPVSPDILATGDIDGNGKNDVVIDFEFGDFPGLWIFMNNSSWVLLHNLSPLTMTIGDIDGGGKDDIIIDFGHGSDLWVYMNNSTWVKLHTLSTLTMTTGNIDGDAGGKDEVIIDFGVPYGVWILMNNSTWVKLHNLSPQAMITGDMDRSGKDDIIVDFGHGIGTWVYMNNSTWVKLHNLSPATMICGDIDGGGKDEVIMSFGSSGIWARMNNSTWLQLHTLSTLNMITGNIDGVAGGKDEVIIDFGAPYGVWLRKSDATWLSISLP